MLAIAISALLCALAVLAIWTIATSVRDGWAMGRGILAELAALDDDRTIAHAPAFRPLRSRPVFSPQGYSRQPVRLRPLRRACAAA